MIVEGIKIQVLRKPVKYITLRVMPADGSVSLTIPTGESEDKARAFAESRLEWIRKTQERIQRQRPRLEYISGEKINLFGKAYTLRTEDSKIVNRVELCGDEIVLHCKPDCVRTNREKIMDCFYKKQLESLLETLLPKWQTIMQEEKVGYSVRKMKTEWGSCTPKRRTIRFNSALASKPVAQIEYVVVHELAHLRQANHSSAFWQIVERHIPNYKELRYQLNHPKND